MAVESFVTRWRKAVRPLPRETPSAALLAQRRRQRKLIHRTLGVLLLAGAGGLLYSHFASAPERAQAEVALGVKKLGPGTYTEALLHFDRAIQIWPQYGEAYLNRAVAEHDVSQPGPALVDLDKALDLDPSSTRAHNERGQIYMETGDTHQAIAEFSKSIRLRPTLDGYYQRGEAYEKLGEHQKAIADFDAAIVESQEAPYAYRARGVAKLASGDREGAAADQEKARQLERDQPVDRDVLLAP